MRLRPILFVAAVVASAALALVFGPGIASASPVALRADIAAPGGRLTLGDVFDGAGSASGVVVATGGQPGGSLVMDARQVQGIAAAHGLEWDNARGVGRLIARVTSAPAAGVRRAQSEEVLTYARDFAAGEVVQAEDIVWAPLSGFGSPIDAPHDARAVIGQAARRPLRAGTAVSLADLSTPKVIKKDEMVTVAFASDGIKLVLQGKAMSGAAVGEVVDILNPASKKIIQAVAVGPDQAVVGPEAERIKSAVQANPRLFASLN
jgi:flagella basal body P-ring formation protein FlgA